MPARAKLEPTDKHRFTMVVMMSVMMTIMAIMVVVMMVIMMFKTCHVASKIKGAPFLCSRVCGEAPCSYKYTQWPSPAIGYLAQPQCKHQKHSCTQLRGPRGDRSCNIWKHAYPPATAWRNVFKQDAKLGKCSRDIIVCPPSLPVQGAPKHCPCQIRVSSQRPCTGKEGT